MIDGARETQFEVVAFVYFAENVLEGTTEAMQGKAISIYKAVGSVGFLIGAIQGPLFLTKLGYDGSWYVFLATYIIASTLAFLIYPNISPRGVHQENQSHDNSQISIKDVTFWTVMRKKSLWPCFISIFFGNFPRVGIASTMTMHLVQFYGFEVEVAYYFFAIWSTAQVIGNCFASCMMPYAR